MAGEYGEVCWGVGMCWVVGGGVGKCWRCVRKCVEVWEEV